MGTHKGPDVGGEDGPEGRPGGPAGEPGTVTGGVGDRKAHGRCSEPERRVFDQRESSRRPPVATSSTTSGVGAAVAFTAGVVFGAGV